MKVFTATLALVALIALGPTAAQQTQTPSMHGKAARRLVIRNAMVIYGNAKPPYGWGDGSGEARPTAWMPENRAFQVRSDRGGRFFLIEQFFPGWRATVDGRPSGIERWKGAFVLKIEVR